MHRKLCQLAMRILNTSKMTFQIVCRLPVRFTPRSLQSSVRYGLNLSKSMILLLHTYHFINSTNSSQPFPQQPTVMQSPPATVTALKVNQATWTTLNPSVVSNQASKLPALPTVALQTPQALRHQCQISPKSLGIRMMVRRAMMRSRGIRASLRPRRESM